MNTPIQNTKTKKYNSSFAFQPFSTYAVLWFVNILILPLMLVIDTWRSKRSWWRKLLFTLLILFTFVSYWTGTMYLIQEQASISLYEMGISDKLVDVHISGRSMMPTIEDGEQVTLNSPKKYGLERGDIVTFRNIETGSISYIKRLIGLSGETVTVMNGQVIIDGQQLEEKYILDPGKTYGNTFLEECTPQQIPENHVMVLGDNRLGSTDSRVVGFVNVEDIDGVIKTGVTPALNPIDESSSSAAVSNNHQLNSQKFIDLLNLSREEQQAGELQTNDKLQAATTARVQQIADNYAGWKSDQQPIDQVLEAHQYQYLLLQEFVTFGYLDEQELLDQILDSPFYRDAFLSDEYLELGLAVAMRTHNQCTFPVITALLAWPTTPNYQPELVNLWESEINVLSTWLGTLKNNLNNPSVDQPQTQELVDLMTEALEIATRLHLKVANDQWYTEAEHLDEQKYEELSEMVKQKMDVYIEQYGQQITGLPATQFESGSYYSSEEYNSLLNTINLNFAQGEYQEQLTNADKLMPLAQNDRESAIAHYWKGLAQYKLDNLTEAKTNLLQATELDVTYAGPYVTLAAVSFEEENPQQGLTYALKCAELDPEYGWCHNNIGSAHMQLGDTAKGIAAFEKAVELDPTSIPFNENLKRARDHAGGN